MYKSFVLLTALFFASNMVPAQNISDSSKVLGEIMIQSNRLQIPFSKQNRDIIIINRKTLDALPVKSVAEILQYAAGIDVRQRGPWGAQADIGIEGGTFDQALVLINGIKVTDPQTGHNMMNLPVNTLAIERIEIVKGAAARIYGVNALTGAINIITRNPGSTGADVQMGGGTSFRNNDSSNHHLFAGYDLSIAAGIHSKKVSQFLSASQTQSSGYRYNTALSNQKVLYQNQIDAGKNIRLNLLGGYVNNQFGANDFYASPADKESKERVQTAIAGISATIQVNPVWVMRPRLSYRYNYDDYIFIRQNPSYYRNKHHTDVWDVELNNSFKSKIGNFGLGMEFRNEAIRSNSLGKRNRVNYGIFGEYSFNMISRLLINAGAYVNYNSDFGWEVLPGIDAGYDVDEHFRIFAGVSTGQRLPTYTDLYYKGPSNIGNPDLQPEHSIQSELGLKYNAQPVNLSVNYFRRNISGFIDWVKDSLMQPWQPQNFQKIISNGISFSSNFTFFKHKPNTVFSLASGLSYTWLNPKVKTSDPLKISHYALDNLRHQLAVYATLGYRSKLNLTIAAKYQQRIQYKDYVLLDAKFSYAVKNWNVFIDGSNLGNVSFIETGAVPLPGRWITAGVKWSWWK